MSILSAPTALARVEVRELPLYAPDSAACPVDLSDNTNAWGASPAALLAIGEIPAGAITRYPSLYSRPLCDAVLRYCGLRELEGVAVVTGCGSDDVLDSTMRAFGGPGRSIAFPSPTFSMIPAFARLNGMEIMPVPLTDRFDVDVDRLLSCHASITYLCSPNNPTSTALPRASVEQVIERARGIVVLDEAYAEFAPDTFLDLIARHPRLLIVRTLSKAFGLAGLRVGYGIGGRELVGLVERARGPYKVNAVAERAALATLAEGAGALGWVRAQATQAVAVRERLAAALRDLGLEPLPSAANFLFVPTPRAVQIGRALRERGVLIRAFSGLPRDLRVLADSNGQALRIGVGPWEMMMVLLDALKAALR